MKIILSALSTKLLDAWTVFFNSEENVEIIQEDITTLKCDAVVSPANSFGFMDGGLDLALSERFGWGVQERLQQQIKGLPEGELLVGKAIAIETGDSDIPFLISAPTMRIPTSRDIDTSVNAYLAMKAILITAVNDPRIASVAIPGLCTGTGNMEPLIAARQMFQAYREIILAHPMDFISFTQAQEYHWNMTSKK
ncbi:macro domain-containing protein [Flavobacterium sp. DGU11]|uniref:Macro domain-containing protein n=1 Tax=Flavobacterium arundinis TaxID=3139143 RepID=A0ABU9I0W2_9FLAO